jgi:hypothetical protein
MNLENIAHGDGIFIQIGAGAGDLDARADCRDGFTELVKRLPKEHVKQIILVEPNPLNIPLLKECWKEYPQSVIYEIAIVPKHYPADHIELFYSPLDGPHYQVASIKKSHIEKHYGTDCAMEKAIVPVRHLDRFLGETVASDKEIELLSLDIEGIDDEILLETTFSNWNVMYLSFEHLHLGENKPTVIQHLTDQGYEYAGMGVDVNGFDYLYVHKLSARTKYTFFANPHTLLHPITFSIPKEKVCTDSRSLVKTKVLSNLIPGNLSTYIYGTEKEYYDEYKSSLFAVTTRKGGWDCMRHYEILANGCLPYFVHIQHCPPNTMYLLPKELFQQCNALFDRQFRGKAMHEITDDAMAKYYALQRQLLRYTKDYLTTDKVAMYILHSTGYANVKRILYLSSYMEPDYLRCLTLHGFKQVFGVNCHDCFQVPHIYKSDTIDYASLYGKGMTYSNLLEQDLHDVRLDGTVEEDIKRRYYDIVIYGSYHRGMPHYDLVCSVYKPNEVILICGEDLHPCNYKTYVSKGHHVFVREL